MKKKLVATVIAAALVASVGIGSTLAYLHDVTDTPTINTFTIGDVEIDLDEPSWQPVKGEDMLPGATVNKNPIVTNVGQTEAFIGIRVDGMEELVAQGFLVKSNSNNAALDAVYDKDGKLTGASAMFAWNPLYTLVDAAGVAVTTATENVLTYGELAALDVDTLYFAYEKAIAAGAQTESLFDTVKLDTDVLGATSSYTIVKHFVDADRKVMNPDDNGLYATEPAKEDGKYIYKFSVAEAEKVNGETVYYDTYAAAKAQIDLMEKDTTKTGYEFNMEIKAAAIQSVNGSDAENWKVDKVSTWYSKLPTAFFN